MLQNRRPYIFIGTGFTFMSIISLVVFFFSFSKWTEPYEGYDHKAIAALGTEQKAVIVNLASKDNVSVNGKHPVIITYSFESNGVDQTDKFQTLDVEKAATLSIGDKLRIKTYNNQSSVQGYEPFEFPVVLLMFIGPVIFFVAGIVMLLIAVVPVFRIVGLYKRGIIKEAEVYAIVPVSGLPITNIGRKVSIDYTYSQNGEKLYGNTTSTDFHLLAEIKPGDTVKIFVSEDGKKSCLIPKKEAVKNNWNINFA